MGGYSTSLRLVSKTYMKIFDFIIRVFHCNLFLYHPLGYTDLLMIKFRKGIRTGDGTCLVANGKHPFSTSSINIPATKTTLQ